MATSKFGSSLLLLLLLPLSAVATAGTALLAAPAAAAGSSAPASAPGSPAALRAEAKELMSAAKSPPPESFARAQLLAQAAARVAPSEPWGALASCDVAARWGDRALVDRCLEKLAAVAPEHPEAKRTLAALGRGRRIGAAIAAAAWLLLAAAVVATAAHALRARARRRGSAAA